MQVDGNRLISKGFKCIMHKGGATVEAEVTGILSTTQMSGEGQKVRENPQFVCGPAKILCTLKCADTFLLSKSDSFLLRDHTETFATGQILAYKANEQQSGQKRQKMKEEYKQSKLRKSLVQTFKKLNQM